MKRLTFSILTLLIALQSGAQDWREMRRQEFSLNFPYKYEVRIGWSGYPILEAANFPNYGNLPFMDYDMIPYYKYTSLESLYGTYQGREYMTGLISGEISIHFRKWFTLAVEAGINGMWGRVYDKYDGSFVRHTRGISLTVMPHARFYWANAKNVRFYSGIGIGLGLGQYDKYFEVYPAFQLSPIGFTVGKKIFAFGETSLGTAYFGGKFGVGYRF
jgi:hypothetical protein